MTDTYEGLMTPLADRLNSVRAVSAADSLSRQDGSGSVAVLPQASSLLMQQLYAESLIRLKDKLLGRIYANNPEFFESLVIDLLLNMGYASRRRDLAQRLGRSHDGGIDGVLNQDELGLDAIYLQAKRLRPGSSVATSQLRDFVGSLEAKRATKGVFVTTAHFSSSAQTYLTAIARRVVLIDGDTLTSLMIRYNIGVCVIESFQFKEVEPSYFSARPPWPAAGGISVPLGCGANRPPAKPPSR